MIRADKPSGAIYLREVVDTADSERDQSGQHGNGNHRDSQDPVQLAFGRLQERSGFDDACWRYRLISKTYFRSYRKLVNVPSEHGAAGEYARICRGHHCCRDRAKT